MVPEFTEAELKKLRACCHTGSPQSRHASRDLIAGRVPNSFDFYCLSKTLNRASMREDRTSQDHPAA